MKKSDLIQCFWRLILVILVVVQLVSCATSHPQSAWEELHLNGAIKDMEVVQKYAVELNDTIVAGERTDAFIKKYYFTDFGKKRKTVELYSDFSFRDSTTFAYDKHHRLVGKKDYDPFSGLWKRYEFSYNSRGQLVEKKCYIPKWNKLAIQWQYTYDKRGFLSSVKRRNFRKGPKFRKRVFIRKPNGEIKQIAVYDASDDLVEREELKYRHKRCVRKVKFDEDGKWIKKQYFQYNKRGRMTQKKILQQVKPFAVQYDYHYKNDEKGNWTAKIVLKNEIPQRVVFRQLTYFSNLQNAY